MKSLSHALLSKNLAYAGALKALAMAHRQATFYGCMHVPAQWTRNYPESTTGMAIPLLIVFASVPAIDVMPALCLLLCNSTAMQAPAASTHLVILPAAQHLTSPAEHSTVTVGSGPFNKA